MGFEKFRHNPMSDLGTGAPSIWSTAEETRERLRSILDATEPIEEERRRLVSLFEQLVEDNARVREVADEASRGASESKWIARFSLFVAIISLLVSVLPLLMRFL